MRYILKNTIIILILSAFFVLQSCKSIDSSQGYLVNFSGCKAFAHQVLGEQQLLTDPSKECIQYKYNNDQTLDITHINAGFNCCPGEITADISINGSTITIIESEKEAGCLCNCLFDIRYQITNLSPGTYKIEIISPYQPEKGPILEATINLSASPEDTLCVTRTTYPWGKIGNGARLLDFIYTNR